MLSLANAISRVAMTRQSRNKPGLIINEHYLTAAETRKHVEVLGRSFDFIHHDELLERIKRPRARPFCLLTFDDGKRSGYTETAPELQRLGVPAIFFVTTGFLSDGVPLWFDQYEALLTSIGAVPAGLERETLKEMPLALISDRVARACRRNGVVMSMDGDRVRPMSWTEARDLARRGFTIGAHSVRHAVLTREPEAEALADIEQSIMHVSAEIGTPCVSFAFPNGNYTARLARHALACGVSTVMTTEPVWVDDRFPSWRLPRVQLYGAQSRFIIELKLAIAATGRWLRNPDGSGRVYRKIIHLQESTIRPLRDGGLASDAGHHESS